MVSALVVLSVSFALVVLSFLVRKIWPSAVSYTIAFVGLILAAAQLLASIPKGDKEEAQAIHCLYTSNYHRLFLDKSLSASEKSQSLSVDVGFTNISGSMLSNVTVELYLSEIPTAQPWTLHYPIEPLQESPAYNTKIPFWQAAATFHTGDLFAGVGSESLEDLFLDESHEFTGESAGLRKLISRHTVYDVRKAAAPGGSDQPIQIQVAKDNRDTFISNWERNKSAFPTSSVVVSTVDRTKAQHKDYAGLIFRVFVKYVLGTREYQQMYFGGMFYSVVQRNGDDFLVPYTGDVYDFMSVVPSGFRREVGENSFGVLRVRDYPEYLPVDSVEKGFGYFDFHATQPDYPKDVQPIVARVWRKE
jgi:hypothetical protein